MHAGEVVGLDDSCEIDCDDEGGQVGVVKGVFTQVALLRGCEWAVVEKMLPGVREALGAIDAEWLVNRRLSGMLEAMTARDDTVANRPRKLAPPTDKDSEGFFRHEHRADEGASPQQSYKTAFGTQPVDADGQSEDDENHPTESMTERGDSLSQRLPRPYASTATTRHSPELPWGPSDEDAVNQEKARRPRVSEWLATSPGPHAAASTPTTESPSGRLGIRASPPTTSTMTKATPSTLHPPFDPEAPGRPATPDSLPPHDKALPPESFPQPASPSRAAAPDTAGPPVDSTPSARTPRHRSAKSSDISYKNDVDKETAKKVGALKWKKGARRRKHGGKMGGE
ncbi:hypothetical protein LTR53_005455 [Teratosphaeriaceae sp. CCFEE 6253]|nr:hypothetical protein LTR53_005455 [Teratosphaeriaceae sp. CCFEE 6253]